MKRIIWLFIVTIVCTLAFDQTSLVQGAGIDDFEKMTFEVELNKDNYLLLEPVVVKFKLSNQTGIPQTIYNPSFLQDSRLEVSFNGKTSVFEQLSSVNGGGIRFLGTVQPNWVSTSDEVLSSSYTGAFFPEPGKYQLHFVLRSWGGSKVVKSNKVEVEIKNPQGINKEAFDFLKKHKEYFGMSSWAFTERDGEALLEEFVHKYSESVYSELAISSLGYMYLSKGELDKAQAEFEKLKSSGNKFIADEAKTFLLNLEEKKTRLESLKQPQ